MTSQSQEARAEQTAEQRRRRRKERAAKARTPEPKNIVSGAGQPLDPGVRRELEEQLGHDLGRVRLHTGRDAGQLTELLGADAVAVGQDVFFREGAFRPGTDEGRRLLAHELLHTVQNPHGLGALRAGRELGAVSLPQQAIEREAESAAQDLVGRSGPEASAPAVEEGQATPGWLRYATVDADRTRTEAIDPATLVDRLANSLVRSLRGDPEDLSQRTRKQLARLPGELLDGVLARLESRLLGSEHDRVLDLVEEIEAYDDFADEGLEREAHEAPAIEPDTAEEVRTERENRLRTAEEKRTQEQRPQPAPGPEKQQAGREGAAGSTPQNAPAGAAQRSGTSGGGSAQGAAPASAREQSSSSDSPGPAGKPDAAQQSGEKSADTTGGKEKEQAGQEENRQQQTPAASKEESAARNRPGAAEAAVAGRQLKQQDRGGQQKPTGSPTAAGRDTQLPGAFSTLDGVRNQDVGGPEEKTEEDPFGSGSESEVEAGGEEPSAWDVKLRPEDFMPQQDLDVSRVPTADTMDPSSSAGRAAPSFPAAPPTKAEQVQADRESEDAEEETAEPEEDTADESVDVESSATETEGGPASATGPGGPAVEQAATAPAVSAAASRDPKSGDDPKAGPVVAQTTVQETQGRSEGGSEAKEAAAKEEKGTAAGGDKAAAAPEKESQQATGGRAAQTDAGAKEAAGGADSAASANSEASGASEASATQGTGAGHDAAGAGASTGASQGAPGTSAATGPTAATDRAQEAVPAPGGRTRTSAAAPKSAPSAAPKSESAAPSESATEEKTAPETSPVPKAGRTSTGGGGGGAGGGGGGGGSAAAPARGKGKKDSGPAPNLSGVAPEAGLATASKLKPHKALEAMGGVGGAVDRTVGDEHKTLASAPPAMERPAGAPQTLQGKPKTDAAAQYSQDPAQQAQEPDREDAKVTGEKEPEGQIEAEKAEEPSGWDTFKMALGFGIGKVASWLGFEVDAQELAAKFAGLPTKDEALKQAQAGNAPGVQMQGAADRTAGEQDGYVDAKGQETVSTARDDSGRGMGEDQVYPNAPKEQLTAQVPGQQGGGQGGAAGAGGATGAVPPEAASEVAEHERGPQFQAAFSEGQKGISEGRQAKDRDFRDAQAKHKQKVDAEIAANTATQAGEREKARGEVTAQREDWRTEQDEELKKLGDKKSERHDKVRKDVADEEKKTDDNVDKEKDGSDKKIQDESDKAERDAEKQRDGAVQDSGNWITKAFDWIKQKVIEIKNAIVRVIRAARDAVVGFIRNFRETVERWINEARKNIVEAIKNLIKDLIEFAVAMVRAVIELANRIRKLITDLIAAAIALVNRLAQALRQAITDLLNAIGKLLSSILDILRKALQAAIKAVVDAVKAVLEFASKLLSALGQWMLIAVDFLSDPGGWLSGAKNSAVDGAKNHLFREVSSAVKAWFQEKIQEIIGVPKAIIDQLVKGGFTLDKIVKEAWDAVVPQLPLIIGELVLTKVVAKLIPGAGWVMAVIDAIRTAWGALSAILRSLGAVLDWLKAVRMGGAGILFAKAVAAGVVALLEVLYQALLNGIGKYVAKVGRRLKGVAAKLAGRKGRGGSKEPGAGGADDKGGKRHEGRAEERSEAGAPKSPGKPTPTAPGTGRPRPSGPTAGRPPAGPGRGRPRTERPASRPTASAPSRPRPEPGQRPRPDRDTPTRPRDDRPAQNRPRDDRDSTRPRDDDRRPDRPGQDRDPNRPGDGRDSTRPRDDDRRRPERDPGRPKDQDPTGPKRDKDGKDNDGRKPKDRRDGDGKPKDGRDGDGRKPKDRDKDPRQPKGGKGPKPGKSTKGKDPHKEKKEKKDRRKSEEKKQHDDRLTKAVARMRPILKLMLHKGVSPRILNTTLQGMRAWYRLSRVAAEGARRFFVRAWNSPPQIVVPGTKHTIEPREALAFVRRLAEEVREKSADKANRNSPAQVTLDEETGKVSRVKVNEGTRMSELVADLDELEAGGAFPEHGARTGLKDVMKKDPATGKKVSTGEQKEYDLPGEWDLEWEGETGGVKMHEMPGGVNTVAHMRQEGQARGDAPPYSKLAKPEGVHGSAYLAQHGENYLKLFKGDKVGREMGDLERNKARTLMAITGYSEKRRDESSRVYSAMLAKMLARASAQGDTSLLKSALADYPVAPPGAQNAIPSKDAWVAGKSKSDQLKELQERYERLLDEADTKAEQNAVKRQRTKERLGITGAPKRKKPLIGGEDLATREAKYIETFLSGYEFEFGDDVSPEKVKQDVFEKIRQEILDAHGLS